MITYRQTRKQRIREEKRKMAVKRKKKVIGAALAGSLAAGFMFGAGQKKSDAESIAYTIQKGDTLYSLAKQYGSTVQELQTVNSIADRDKIHIGQKLAVPFSGGEAGTYIVHKGDTLYSLSKKYGVAVSDLKKENNLAGDEIRVGQFLYVPTHFHKESTELYIVYPGDTLWNISERFGISMKKLKEANGLKEDRVLIGQKLTIPGDIVIVEATVSGAADNFTVEFTNSGKPLALKVPYGTSREMQKLAGQKVVIAYKNDALVNIR